MAVVYITIMYPCFRLLIIIAVALVDMYVVPCACIQRLLITCHLLRPNKRKLTILDDVSSIVRPGR